MRMCARAHTCACTHAQACTRAHAHARGEVQKFVFFGARGARSDSSTGRSGPLHYISPVRIHILQT